MRLTITTILCSCALVALAVTGASAQTSYTLSGTCKPDILRSIPAGDQPGHAFGISHGTCSDKETVGGATSTSAQYSEKDDVTPTRTKGSGIFTVTYNTGDKIFYKYKLSLNTKGGVVQSGKGEFKANGGTGKLKGITAKGTCTFSAGATAGTNNYSCSGQYTLAGAMSH
ncbi:MAG: hypothetical protein WB681_02500 [Candidatus Cybelea sp.]